MKPLKERAIEYLHTKPMNEWLVPLDIGRAYITGAKEERKSLIAEIRERANKASRELYTPVFRIQGIDMDHLETILKELDHD